jgi:hypothetical protein
MVAQTQSTPTVQPVTSPYAVFTDMAKPDDLSFLGSLYWDIAAKDRATGLKKMSVDEITRLKEIEALPDKASAASLLHQADDPLQVGLLIETLMGVKDASQRLSKLQAGLADEALRLNMVRISSLNMFEPMKVKEASDSLKAQIDLFREQQLQIRKEMDLISPTGDINALSPEARNSFIDLQRRSANLDNSIDATREVYEFAAYGKVPDKLDPTSAFYRPDQADAILSDILRREDWVTRVTRQDLYEASLMSKMPFMAKNNRYTRVVAGSRRRRGRAAYEYAAEGTGWLPRSIVVGVNNGQPVRETTGWFAKSSFEGTNRFQRNLRVWRWLGAETPSGYIGLKGTATVGSEREFRAATNLDLYRGDGVQIQEKQIVQKEVNGRMFDEIVVLSRTVGGRARRDALYQRFYQALNNPDEDMVSVLGEIEENIMQDLALAYGLDLKGMDEVLKIANRRRDQSLKIVRERGYSVDEDGSVNMIPYLETHLINGTYMQNFMDLERSLSYATRTGNIGAIQRGLQSPLHLANNGYEIFQNFWRPITLLRLNYTQRNVFEGLVRSMAYSASLAPLSWPVRATVNGTRNRIVKSVMKRRVEDVRARVSGTDYGAAVRRYRAADDEIMRLRMAIEVPDANGNLTFVETMRTADGSVTRRTMSEAQYQRRLQTLANERSAAEASMAANKAQFEKAIEGTKFKTWRDSQITALNKQLEESEQWTSVYLEGMQQKMLIDPDFSLADMTVNEINHLATETALAVKINQQLFELEHSPSAAIAAWQSSAGRQRRIGSGTTMGPDGNYYQDAFAGPLEQINRSLMSADNTVKQSLSLRFDAYNSLFQKIVIKENQAVPFTPGTRKQWIQGMIRAIEDDSSSRVVRKLLDTDFNEDAVIAWLKSDDEQAVEFMTRVMPMTNGNANLKQMATSMRDVKGRKVRTIDENALRAYVVETKDKVLTQMQGKTAFLDLLRRRAAQKRNMETSGQLTADDIEAALATLTPDELGGLGAIQGAEIIQMGTDTAMGIYS